MAGVQKLKSRIPKAPRLSRFFSLPYVYDFVIAWFALFAGIAMAIQAASASWKDHGTADIWSAGFWILAAVGAFAFTLLKIVVQFFVRKHRDSPSDLQGCLYTLHAVLVDTHNGPDDPMLRLTIHRPADDGRQLEQVIDYVGDSRAGRCVGRRFPSHTGIIGKVFATKKPMVASRTTPDYSQYIKELTTTWDYTEAEAQCAGSLDNVMDGDSIGGRRWENHRRHRLLRCYNSRFLR